MILHVVETSFAWYTAELYQQIVSELRDFGAEVLQRAMVMAEEQGVTARTLRPLAQSSP